MNSTPRPRTWGDLREDGQSPRSIARRKRSGQLVTLRPAVYADGDAWSTSTTEQRILARARALERVSRRRPVLWGETAAAAHGLPLLWPDTSVVHVLTDSGRPGAAAGVVRHRPGPVDVDVVEIGGFLCTSLARTVSDVARTASFEQAVVVADAALRRVAASGPGRYDADRAERFTNDVLHVARASRYGAAAAQRALRFADGRADRPGESLTRVRLHEIGFRRMIPQVPTVTPFTTFYSDVGLPEENALIEFDGRIKYVDGAITFGRSADQIVDEEKQREDLIRGVRQCRLARVGWPHVRTSAHLSARLAAFGIHPSR